MGNNNYTNKLWLNRVRVPSRVITKGKRRKILILLNWTRLWKRYQVCNLRIESLQSTTNELQARVDSLESDLVECEEVDNEPEPSTRDSQTRKRKVSDDLKFEQVMS